MSAAEQWAAKERAKSGHIRARDASVLTALFRTANPTTRSSSRRVLELLLRFGYGRLPVKKTMGWIADESDISTRMARYAVRDLGAMGLVDVVVEGGGLKFSQFLVNIEALRERLADPDPDIPEQMAAVARLDELLLTQVAEPCESDDSQDLTPATIAAPPGNHCRTPRQPLPGSSDGAPLTTVTPRNPLPPERSSAPATDPSPAASRGDPLRWQNQSDLKCVHGRTRAQSGCRLCHTTRRDDAKMAKRAEAEGEARKAIQYLADQREAEVQARAVSVPPPAKWRDR